MIITKGWSTGFFLFDIGCFQGCVLSSILFDCVFNLLLDFLQPYEKIGYAHSDIDLFTMDKAYADDLNLTTTDKDSNQKVLDTTCTWLAWTETMKAKPKKCVSFAQRKFGGKSREDFVPIKDTIYSPYGPLLKIDGQPIKFILDPSNKDPFKSKHFKFLCRWISVNVNETDVQKFVEDDFLHCLKLIDSDLTNGLMKAWMYEFGLLARLSWSGLVYDLPRSFGINLEYVSTRYLKKWIGVHKSADTGILYRSNDRFGLAITPTSVHLQKMGVTKCSLLKNSKDSDIRLIYQAREERKAKETGRVWSSTRSLTEAESIVTHNTRFAGQTNKQGLGSGNYNHNPTLAETRKLCSNTIMQTKQEQFWSHSHSLSMQGLWTHWAEHTLPLDFSWNTLIHGPGKKIISFLLNATINTLPSPHLLNIIGLTDDDKCPLCQKKGYVSHILSGCKIALYSGRYSWRHDSILYTMIPYLEKHIEAQNSSKSTLSIPSIKSSFISTRDRSVGTRKSPSNRLHLLSNANDWQILVDLHHLPIVFPPEICVTNQRPDIIIWSPLSKSILLIELTSPCEESLIAANIRKKARYDVLAERLRAKDWNCTVLPFEVGARGFVARTMNTMLRKIGFTPREASSLCKTCSLTAAFCSYSIWNHRHEKHWNYRTLFRPANPHTP